MAEGLGFEETELRLGLPGGGNDDASARGSGKRGYAETIDLKLKLEPAPAVGEDEVANEGIAAATAEQLSSSAAADGKMKRSPSQTSVVTSDPEKPRAPKAQAVGWPPVRSFRKNILAAQTEKGDRSAALVKVSMDGAPYLRKLDIGACNSYDELSMALEKMFSTMKESSCVPTYEDKDGDWMLVGDVPWEMFVSSCKRLRIMKGSEAIGLGGKCKIVS
ncbi:auxin-responsive protein IAA30 [Brachypodium distachyon]|uniref:Auxin-responsive protein n=1 Tax=Brachypodium distachyon TaxID=15368 RepID=I1GQ63_BRADI|nr:auxin-responsive protein IAA30 [Brachypodium distachyon]KQK14081.1 hypothetical protein BRADI_1g14240v3 [Brachypodium distachyon]KQK14083.1 hypothetical protein BRADI_1g14240v3 [Brachypodium distachyon]|eukprot:XP_003562220.2 auxin-responsive protein IAA30 [Brachypodium distachyon]